MMSNMLIVCVCKKHLNPHGMIQWLGQYLICYGCSAALKQQILLTKRYILAKYIAFIVNHIMNYMHIFLHVISESHHKK